jgi:tRNA modification GTPase
VADLISSDNEASQIAMQQMRGILNEIKLRELLNFASLIELELDFAKKMSNADHCHSELLNRIEFVLKRLIDSFAVET